MQKDFALQALAEQRFIASGATATQKESPDPKLREAEIAGSWAKTVISEGVGQAAWAGARASVHVVGRAATPGSTAAVDALLPFEDSRDRAMPRLLTLGDAQPTAG